MSEMDRIRDEQMKALTELALGLKKQMEHVSKMNGLMLNQLERLAPLQVLPSIVGQVMAEVASEAADPRARLEQMLTRIETPRRVAIDRVYLDPEDAREMNAFLEDLRETSENHLTMTLGG